MEVTYTYEQNTKAATTHVDRGFRRLPKSQLAKLVTKLTNHQDVKIQNVRIIYYPY